MLNQLDCTHYPWEPGLAVVGKIYEFPSPIIAMSIVEGTGRRNNPRKPRSFKIGKLVNINNNGEPEKFVFTGRKVPESKCKKSNRRYSFSLPS